MQRGMTDLMEKPMESKHTTGRKRRSSTHAMEGWREFERRLEVLRTQGKAKDFDLEEKLQRCLTQPYKGRDRVDGTLLHYAIEQDSLMEARVNEDMSPEEFRPMHWQSAVDMVLNAGARADSWATYMAGNEEAQFSGVHLAAGMGCAAALYMLTRAGADVNQKTKRGGQAHYCAIHEACFCKKSETVNTLISLRADVNETNMAGETPLHIVAKNGDAAIAELLVESGARLDLRLPAPGGAAARPRRRHSLFEKVAVDLVGSTSSMLEEPKGKTPLEVAISGDRRFPKDQLHLLAPFCNEGYDDCELLPSVLDMCKANRPAAAELVRSLCQQAATDPARRQHLAELFKRSTSNLIECFAHTLRLAPEVALDILELINDAPKAVAPEYHALPTMSNFEEHSEWVVTFQPHIRSVHTVYERDVKWEYFPQDEEKYPSWHETFAPPPRGSLTDFEVSIKVLQFPNVMDLRIFNALNTLRSGNVNLYERAFSRDVVKAMVHCSWKYVSRSVHFCISLDILIVVILSWWAFAEKASTATVVGERYQTFSFILACVFHEFFIWVYVMIHAHLWGFAARTRLTTPSLIELATTMALGVYVLVWQFWQDGEFSAMLFCLNVLLRWFKLAHMLRLVSGLGEKILAITSSVFPMAEFFIFAMLIWFAFLAAFASIRGKNSVRDIQRSLFFVVFGGDPEAITNLEGLDENSLVVFILVCLVTLVFSVAILNLMIGMYGSMFSTMEAKSSILFLQERCWAVEHALLAVQWPIRDNSRLTGTQLGDIIIGRRVAPWILACLLVLLWFVIPKGGVRSLVASSMALAAAMLLMKSSLVNPLRFNRDLIKKGAKQTKYKKDGCWYQAVDDSRSLSLQGSRASRSSEASSSEEDEPQAAEDDSPLFLWMCHRVCPDSVKIPVDMRLQQLFEGMEGKIKELDKKVDGLSAELKDVRKAAGLRNVHGSLASVRSHMGRHGAGSGLGSLAFAPHSTHHSHHSSPGGQHRRTVADVLHRQHTAPD